MPLPGSAQRLAAGPGTLLWAVREDGTVQRYDGGRWQVQLGQKARDVAVDTQGNAYIAREDGSIGRWTPGRTEWETLPGRALRLTVAQDGTLWTVAPDGAIARLPAGQQPEVVAGRARDIASGGGAVYIASAEGRLQRWQEGARNWEDVQGAPLDVALVAASPSGVLWTANARGAILTQAPIKTQLALGGGFGQQAAPDGVTFGRRGARGGAGGPYAGGGRSRAAAAASAAALPALRPPSAVTDPNPFEFVDTLGTASRIAIGQDGSVFAIGLDGNFYRWSNLRRSFVQFPGSLVRMAVDPGGTPWGINQAGRIFRHTGSDWRQVRGTASDIAIASNRTIMITSSAGALGRFDPPTEGFQLVPGELFFIALAPDGVPWGLLRNGMVQRCPALPCETVGFDARNISIGPDGSVFIVNFANELRRFNAVTNQFDFIPVPGHVPAQVAVGPFGRPWVVTSTGRVLSSRFFERDESVDLQTASSTATPTTGTGDVGTVLGTTTTTGSGFTFSKNMQFTTHASPCVQFVVDLHIGQDGTVVVRCDPGSGELFRYNSTGRKFDRITTVPGGGVLFGPVDVDADGRLWLTDNDSGRVYRQKAKNGSSFDIINVGNGTARDIVIGPDGTAYYIDSSGTLYRKTSSATSFTKMLNGDYLNVAVGVTNDVWVRTSSDVFQIVGGQLEKRPLTGSPSAFDMGGGADGSIYVVQIDSGDSFPKLYKWNANNKTFDRVDRDATNVDVAPNGRVWYLNTSFSPFSIFMAK
jgi:streptogramin lyase